MNCNGKQISSLIVQGNASRCQLSCIECFKLWYYNNATVKANDFITFMCVLCVLFYCLTYNYILLVLIVIELRIGIEKLPSSELMSRVLWSLYYIR